MHVQIGSRIVLTCHVRQASGPPEYVFWYRGSDVLNYSPLVTIQDFYKESSTVASTGQASSTGFVFRHFLVFFWQLLHTSTMSQTITDIHVTAPVIADVLSVAGLVSF